MAAELDEKVDRYETLLAGALDAADTAVPANTPLHDAAVAYREMAESYLEDGRHFREHDDPVNALAAFSYGHGWLDAGARMGLFDIPSDTDLFAV
ncbi:MAG: DUF357 domain-containing protein [Natronomonas sp.]